MDLDKPQNGQDAITTMVVKELVKGYNFEQIAERKGIPVEDVVRKWGEYVSTRTVMSQEEQWVLMLLRLEDLYRQAHDRLTYSQELEDFKYVLPILESIEKLQGLNESRKQEANERLTALSRQQGQLMVMAFQQFGVLMKQYVDNALENRTIKAIKESLSDYDDKVLELTQEALTVVEENNNA